VPEPDLRSPNLLVGIPRRAISSKYEFWWFDRRNIEVNRDPFVVAARDQEIECLQVVRVELLMRHVRREVDKITGTYLRGKL